MRIQPNDHINQRHHKVKPTFDPLFGPAPDTDREQLSAREDERILSESVGVRRHRPIPKSKLFERQKASKSHLDKLSKGSKPEIFKTEDILARKLFELRH